MKKDIILGCCLMLFSLIIPGGAGAEDALPTYPEAQVPSTSLTQVKFVQSDFSVSMKLTESVRADSALWDVLILRPAGIIACAVGLGASVVALPFAAASNSREEVTQALIADPFAYTFKRPIGQIDP